MYLKLTNKIALVTGASKGLGYATAFKLSEEGANVAINSRSSSNLEKARQNIINQTGNDVISVPGDVSDPESPQNIIDTIIQTWGKIDIIITNSGGPPAGNFFDIDDNAWLHSFENNFMSNVRLIRAAMPFLKKSESPSILTITSISVKQPLPNMILSNSIRSATMGLTKSLSNELGQFGIRCNSILPGWTETERVNDLLKTNAGKNNTTVDIELEKSASEIPLGRFGKPEEFAYAATFLVSPVASFISGMMFTVDGGFYKGIY